MQGLSSRAHAFSVEALVGKSCKRVKVESEKDERLQDHSTPEKERSSSAGTMIADGEMQESERRRKASLLLRKPVDSERDPESEREVRMELQGSDLWNRFHEIGTEMIITKAGRRMFPSVRVKVRHLDPFKQYYIAMDIMPVDSKRYRYVYHSSQWMVAGNTDHSCIAPRLYVHPDSPCSGETWMRQVISFDRVKLTNNEMDDKGHIILQSMHRYKPRVHVIEHDPRLDLAQIPSLPAEGVHTFSFSETQFTTVTAYQNQQITKLKIDRNPFAKGFRDPGRNRGVLDGILESYPWRNPISLDFKPFALELQDGSSGSPGGCVGLSPLKSLLPPSTCPTSSGPFALSCASDSALHGLSVPFCYKISPATSLLAARAYNSHGAEGLRGYQGLLRPLAAADFPLLSALHSKKVASCRGQCLQGPPGASSACFLHLQGLRGSGVNSVHHDPLPSTLASPYSLYGCGLPTTPQLSSLARQHAKLANGGGAAATAASSATQTESLLRQAALWHPAINHCL
ncbi:T-box transcription factor TBX22-like [Alosa alosa]|nr:T-box transcription factor TBX22-like [Alosa sapidissima]XP_048087804.1 T-box transcription factor TBX22-like [Alosa alosa]